MTLDSWKVMARGEASMITMTICGTIDRKTPGNIINWCRSSHAAKTTRSESWEIPTIRSRNYPGTKALFWLSHWPGYSMLGWCVKYTLANMEILVEMDLSPCLGYQEFVSWSRCKTSSRIWLSDIHKVNASREDHLYFSLLLKGCAQGETSSFLVVVKALHFCSRICFLSFFILLYLLSGGLFTTHSCSYPIKSKIVVSQAWNI